MSEYEHLQPEKDGWSKWTHFPRVWKHQCCACSEKHSVQMKIDKVGKIWMRWKTDNRGRKSKNDN